MIRLWLGIFFAITGCSQAKIIDLASKNLSLFKGYHTSCNGRLSLLDPVSKTVKTQLIGEAGSQELRVFVVSGAMLPSSTSLLNYYCFDHSDHIVKFQSKPGKYYRFFVERNGEQQYQVSTYEYVDPRFPEAVPVKTSSNQINITHKCGFVPTQGECSSFH